MEGKGGETCVTSKKSIEMVRTRSILFLLHCSRGVPFHRGSRLCTDDPFVPSSKGRGGLPDGYTRVYTRHPPSHSEDEEKNRHRNGRLSGPDLSSQYLCCCQRHSRPRIGRSKRSPVMGEAPLPATLDLVGASCQQGGKESQLLFIRMYQKCAPGAQSAFRGVFRITSGTWLQSSLRLTRW